ncbi:MAG: hypothetical protein KDI98_05385, partial [Hyphomicrobiaceae bacterium]|nr:hypothetical protein [Hyphomicrobiaceae bacterium]
MTNSFFLTVFILVNGGFVRGDLAEGSGGWHPRAYETMAECIERRDFAAEQNATLRERDERITEMRFFCSEAAPLDVMPEE